uniref:Uncharacterized protein n=1 Tax=viral metagenome TaxID=1070528 RepID=A0A6C0CB72_9ZZZZ
MSRNLYQQDFECANIGPFKVMSKNCVDATLNVQILVHSTRCQEIYKDCIDETLNVPILVHSK